MRTRNAWKLLAALPFPKVGVNGAGSRSFSSRLSVQQGACPVKISCRSGEVPLPLVSCWLRDSAENLGKGKIHENAVAYEVRST